MTGRHQSRGIQSFEGQIAVRREGDPGCCHLAGKVPMVRGRPLRITKGSLHGGTQREPEAPSAGLCESIPENRSAGSGEFLRAN